VLLLLLLLLLLLQQAFSACSCVHTPAPARSGTTAQGTRYRCTQVPQSRCVCTHMQISLLLLLLLLLQPFQRL
jgi:hypothetical protein